MRAVQSRRYAPATRLADRRRLAASAQLAMIVLVALSAASAVDGISLSAAAFSSAANVGGNSVSAKADWVAPVISGSVIAPTSGSAVPGFVRQGGSYYVYAQVADTGGSPPSGVSSVSANVSNVTTAQTAVALTTTGGPWTVGGTSYSHRSAALTANASLPAGAKSYSLSASDLAANSAASSHNVTVDNTAPAVSAAVIERTSGGGTGFLKQGQSYYVYASVSDATAGLASVTANVSNVSTGQSAVSLGTSGGPWTVGGTSYSHRSASLTANGTLSEGAKSWTVTATDNATNSVSPSHSVTIDNSAPAVAAAVIERTSGGGAGFLKQGQAFYVYADVSDTSSGLASVTANVGNVTTGATAVALTTSGGPWTVGGTSYNHRSASQTANGTLAEGAKSWTVTATDNAANSVSPSHSVTIDNSAPSVSDSVIQKASAGSAGFIGQGQGYYVYANATDGSSGLASVTANVSNISTGQSAVSLSTSGGPWTVGGTSYSYRSASLTANGTLAEGAKSYTVTATDNVGSASSPSFSVTVDNADPTISASVIRLEGNANLVGGQNPGYIGQGLSYRVYANIDDTGSGVETATVNLTAITSGQSAATMSYSASGWATVSGTLYHWRSGVIAANSSLTNGSTPSFTFAATDAAGNSATAADSAAVDNNATIQPATNFSVASSCELNGGISLRASSSTTSSGTSIIVTAPAGVQAGDVMVAQVTVRASGTISAPNGWTTIAAHDLSGWQNQASFYRVATASEPASYTFSTPSARNAAGIVAYSGVSSTQPIAAWAANTGFGTTATAPSVTTSVGNTRLVTLFGIRQVNGSAPTGMSVLWNLTSAGGAGGSTADAFDQAIASAGATGTRSTSWSGAVEWIAHTIALMPSTTPRVTGTWTATPSSFATGHRFRRYLGGAHQQTYSVTPRTTTSQIDDNVAGGTQYEYRLRAYVTAGGVTWETAELSRLVTPSSCSP